MTRKKKLPSDAPISEPKERHEIEIPARVARLLERIGEGDLSAGIEHAARVVELDEERLDTLMPEDE